MPIVGSIEPVGASSPARIKPRLLLRGRRRKAVQKLLHAAQVVKRQDDAETNRGARKGYNPYLWRGIPQSASDKALTQVITRSAQVLAAKG